MKRMIFAVIFIATTGFASTLVTIFIVADYAQAQTCTSMQANCIKKCATGTYAKQESACRTRCRNAHSMCMKTGTWDNITVKKENVKKK